MQTYPDDETGSPILVSNPLHPGKRPIQVGDIMRIVQVDHHSDSAADEKWRGALVRVSLIEGGYTFCVMAHDLQRPDGRGGDEQFYWPAGWLEYVESPPEADWLKATDPTSPRRSALHEAADLIDGDRDHDYGSPHDNFANIAAMWQVLFPERQWTPGDVSRAQLAVKLARTVRGYKRDSGVDMAGYAGLYVELEEAP